MELNVEVARAAQLAINLSVAGALLLAMEVYFNNRIFGIFGAFSLVAAGVMAFKGYGIVIAMLFLLAYVTLFTLGFLVILAYFPDLPIARQFLKRTRQRLEEEEAEERDREERKDDEAP